MLEKSRDSVLEKNLTVGGLSSELTNPGYATNVESLRRHVLTTR